MIYTVRIVTDLTPKEVEQLIRNGNAAILAVCVVKEEREGD